MAGFIPRAILAFLWNPLSGATPFRKKKQKRGHSPGDFGVSVEPTLGATPLSIDKRRAVIFFLTAFSSRGTVTSRGLGMPGGKRRISLLACHNQGVYPPARDTPTLGASLGGPSADGGLNLLGKDGYETG